MEGMEDPPLLTCKCRAPRCLQDDCMGCSRCGCDHDGYSVAEKLTRKRGRPKKTDAARLAAAKKPRMGAAAKQQPRAEVAAKQPHVEVPPARGLRKLPPVTYAVPSESEDDEREPKPRKYGELLSSIGFSDERINHIRKNIGAAEMRSDPDMWDSMRVDCGNYERKARGVIMGLYSDALLHIAEAVCGPDAAAASIEFFKKRLKVEKEDKEAVKKVIADARKEMLLPWGRLLAASKKGTIERRVMRAVMCQTFSVREVEELGEAVPGFSISRTIFTKSRRDYDVLCEDGVLNEDRTTRTRFDPGVVDRAIDTLLSRPNVSYVSFGEKRMKVDGVVVTVPSIRRKRAVREIYDDYKAAQGDDVVSRSTFYRLSRLVTHGDTTSRRGTDSLTGTLLDDSVGRLLRIVSDHLPLESGILTEKLGLVKDWLRYSFCDANDSSTAGCPRHDVSFRLTSGSRDSESRAVTCTPCLKMHALQAYIKQRLGEKQVELRVVDDCFHKMDMFMAYQLRVLNQQTAIDELFEKMKERCEENGASSEALVVIDFKRKVAPMYYREKPNEHDNVAGMSWHSVMVRFWSTGESEGAKPVETSVYFDHVAEHTQDKTAVVALIEAMIVSIKRDLPHITSIVVQSDNASYYQNSLVAVVLPVLGAAYGLRVSRFIHTEASDGKSPLDAHFARAMKKAVSWVQQGNSCTTPLHLVEALAADGGLPNSVAQLVEYDSERLEQLADQAALTETAFSEISSVANDILYAYPEAGASGELTSFSSSPSYNLRAFSYSGVGDGIEIEVRPQEGRCVATDASAGVTAVASDSEHDDDDVDSGDELTGLLDEEGADESELDVDDDCEMDHEVVFPNTANGCMTRVKIVTIAQVRLRERKWKATDSTTLLPVSRSDPQPRAEDEKDIVAYTKRSLHERTVSGRLDAFSSATLPEQMARLCDDITIRTGGPKPLVHAGSARRPVHANPYGAKYVAAFKADIREILKPGGQLARWGKQAPLRVLEALQYKYPGRYDLPGESDIRAEIAGRRDKVVRVPPSKEDRRKQRQLLTAAQSGEGNGDDSNVAKRRNPLATEYSVFLEGLVAGKPSVKPLEALQAFRDKFPNATDVPDEKVKAKVSNLKTKAALQRR